MLNMRGLHGPDMPASILQAHFCSWIYILQAAWEEGHLVHQKPSYSTIQFFRCYFATLLIMLELGSLVLFPDPHFIAGGHSLVACVCSWAAELSYN